jgi:hypothetical protein
VEVGVSDIIKKDDVFWRERPILAYSFGDSGGIGIGEAPERLHIINMLTNNLYGSEHLPLPFP